MVVAYSASYQFIALYRFNILSTRSSVPKSYTEIKGGCWAAVCCWEHIASVNFGHKSPFSCRDEPVFDAKRHAMVEKSRRVSWNVRYVEQQSKARGCLLWVAICRLELDSTAILSHVKENPWFGCRQCFSRRRSFYLFTIPCILYISE